MEIIVGYMAESIALIADSFHMLSDLLALGIAFYAIKLAKQRTRSNNLSFGYQRAEILGAFANSIFLLALCFTIIIEAIQRFVTPVEIENPKLVLIVGCVGLTTNILGMILFGGHVGHNHDHGDGGHGGHGHSHSHEPKGNHSHEGSQHEHGHGHEHKEVEYVLPDNASSDSVPMKYGAKLATKVQAEADRIRAHSHDPESGHSHGHSHDHDRHSHEHHTMDIKEKQVAEKKSSHGHAGHDHGNMNMRGLFLHALGDALGSVGVILSSLIIMFADGKWRYYMDPVISLLISGLIISSAVPLVRSASFILLQGVPSNISLETIKKEILELAGVLGIHEFHVWGLSDSKNVASVHVRVLENGAVGYMEVATSIKKLLHGYGIHSTTVQPEFARPASVASDYDDETGCLLKCEGGDCAEQVCCPDDEELLPVLAAVVSTGGPAPVPFLVSEAQPTQPVRHESPTSSVKGKVASFTLGKKDETAVHSHHTEGEKHEHSHGHGGSSHGSHGHHH
ncbi:hypothetical protein BCR33DRAFT_677596 [Rhizoclosmatium globosum]|uniref:Cation efflux protein n=1 Tax=Rhizoclosmatium globosum TaxID=329046 RepID=A0A1Y2CPC9_9FUNG|nr:hypothetical protein BCR33DRAFT_677596 [Rhizoclosmatium globosum]|eukprot:ORY48694.1 hypothetical protein BCR33DRAFT_677596 [Rhizoclosmatium globosum]